MAAKLTARTELARDVKLGFMTAQDMLDDGKAEADPAILPRPAPIHAKKPLR